MRVAVIGSGGREHALLAGLARDPAVTALYAVPGNAGTAALATNVPGVPPDEPEAVAAWAARERIDLTVVGPEAPLVAGVADALAARGLKVFGPSAAAARIEGSKAFAKEVMAAAGVPTARAEVFDDPAKAIAALDGFGPPWVVKADGLAAGKGVTVTTEREAARAAIEALLSEGALGAAGKRLLLEEYLEGPEASLLAVSDGETVLPLAPARDYKRAGDGDTGPNTGGMGAYSPLPDVPPDLVDEIRRAILEPTVAALAERGTPYRGVLYAGLALTRTGPRVLEFNCRFGDPETQVVVPRLASSLLELLTAASEGRLAEARPPAWDGRAAVTVVLASPGYPGSYPTGLPITGVEAAGAVEGVTVFHAGTARDAAGRLVTAGGRVLNVTALGRDLAEARARAYDAAARVRFEGARVHYRHDIAAT